MSKISLLIDLKNCYNEINHIPSDYQIILNQEIENRNPKALTIRDWYNNLTAVYNRLKGEIENDEITYFSFDEISDIPHTMLELYTDVENNKISNYKISPYVDVNFTDDRIHLVDFKRHLQADVALVKKNHREANGRPTYNEYFYNDELMAKITFTFISNENNLLTQRSETLQYVKNDDSFGTEIVIKNKFYNLSDPSDAALVTQERICARTYIVDALNIFILGVLMNYHPDKTQNDVIEMMLMYWEECEISRKRFIDLGLPSWKNEIEAIDINDLPADCTWFAYVINGEGTTVKDYAYNTLNY